MERARPVALQGPHDTEQFPHEVEGCRRRQRHAGARTARQQVPERLAGRVRRDDVEAGPLADEAALDATRGRQVWVIERDEGIVLMHDRVDEAVGTRDQRIDLQARLDHASTPGRHHPRANPVLVVALVGRHDLCPQSAHGGLIGGAGRIPESQTRQR